MPQITYVEHGGQLHTIEVASGLSVMEGAVRNGIPGIDADCGGACACATCHVYVDAGWLDVLPPKSPIEEQMLDCANNTTSNSRLSCQIRITAALDGLRVSLPESQ